MTHPEILQCDRDVLAREFAAVGDNYTAARVLAGHVNGGLFGSVVIALRAIASVRGERPSGDAVEITMLRAVIGQFAHPDNWNDAIGCLQWTGKRHAVEWAQATVLTWDPEAKWSAPAPLAADRARGRAALVWRTPEEWDRTPRGGPHAMLWLLCDDDTIFNRSSESPWPHDNPHVIAWAFPVPPPWAATPAETAPGHTQGTLTDGPVEPDDRLSPDEAFTAMRELRDRRPQRNFTPADWRAWETEKAILLERVWRSANDPSRTAPPPDPHRAASDFITEEIIAAVSSTLHNSSAAKRFTDAVRRWRGRGG